VWLAQAHLTGRGMARSRKEARFWLRKAAEEDHPVALRELALVDFERSTAPRVLRRAVSRLRTAAKAGDAWAQYHLGECYLEGEGVPRNQRTAMNWFEAAAEQGLEEAEQAMMELEE